MNYKKAYYLLFKDYVFYKATLFLYVIMVFSLMPKEFLLMLGLFLITYFFIINYLWSLFKNVKQFWKLKEDLEDGR
jgi:hypothetical protein